MTFEVWWQYNGWRVYELLWAVVAFVGLVIAIRQWWRRRPAARWATGAFAVMLVKAGYALGLVKWLAVIPHVHQLLNAAGFALLIPAIFAGRTPVPSHDPDAD